MYGRAISVCLALMLLSGCQTIDKVSDSVSSSLSGIYSSIAGDDDAPSAAATTSSAPAADASQNQTSTASSQTAGASPYLIAGAVPADDVIDGDTIVLAGNRIRLFGIDAPEIDQSCQEGGQDVPCGEISRNALIGFTARSTVQCTRVDRDRYGRDVSRCKVGKFDISKEMVRTGMAVAYRQYSATFVLEEDEARGSNRGIWKYRFEKPWDWRAVHKQ